MWRDVPDCLKQQIEVLSSTRQDERRATGSHGAADVSHDQTVSLVIASYRGIEVVDRRSGDRLEVCIARQDRVSERSGGGCSLRAEAKSNRTALHEDDRMMAVFGSQVNSPTFRFVLPTELHRHPPGPERDSGIKPAFLLETTEWKREVGIDCRYQRLWRNHQRESRVV